MPDENLPSSKGGHERARRLSPAERKEIARQGAYARWRKEGKEPPLFAEYGSEDRPLRIGSIEIPCYVIMDGDRPIRVLAQRGLQSGVGLSRSGGKGGARRIVALLRSFEIKGLDIRNLIARANSPIRFIPPHGGNPADGYESSIMPDICDVIIEAGRRHMLLPRQAHLARQCATLQHAFAKHGLENLIDRATGYEEMRPRDMVAKLIEKYVAKELRPWVKTFPSDFYKEIFRLNNWNYYEDCGRPGVVGKWTDDIVYKRLPTGVRDKLYELIPRNDKGQLKNRLHQGLTETFGYLKLQEHLTAVVMLARYSPDWRTFMYRLDRELPRSGNTRMLPYQERQFLAPPNQG